MCYIRSSAIVECRCLPVHGYVANISYTAIRAYHGLLSDAGHAGWLGWPANLQPAATLFAQMYTAGGASPFIRGLATNVANYNALVAASPDPVTQGDPNYDELLYITNLQPLLKSAGFPAQFITDMGRSGVQNLRNAWGDWCNIKGAGFGLRPGTATGSALIDQIVWVKPGGECDGTSNSSSPRYDSTCSLVSPSVYTRVAVANLCIIFSPMPCSLHQRPAHGSRRTSSSSSTMRTPPSRCSLVVVSCVCFYTVILYEFFVSSVSHRYPPPSVKFQVAISKVPFRVFTNPFRNKSIEIIRPVSKLVGRSGRSSV